MRDRLLNILNGKDVLTTEDVYELTDEEVKYIREHDFSASLLIHNLLKYKHFRGIINPACEQPMLILSNKIYIVITLACLYANIACIIFAKDFISIAINVVAILLLGIGLYILTGDDGDELSVTLKCKGYKKVHVMQSYLTIGKKVKIPYTEIKDIYWDSGKLYINTENINRYCEVLSSKKDVNSVINYINARRG